MRNVVLLSVVSVYITFVGIALYYDEKVEPTRPLATYFHNVGRQNIINQHIHYQLRNFQHNP